MKKNRFLFPVTILALIFVVIPGKTNTAMAVPTQTSQQAATQITLQTVPLTDSQQSTQNPIIPSDTEGFTIVPAYPAKKNSLKFDFELKPGQKIEDYVAVKNYAREKSTFFLYAANSTLSNQGTIAYRTRFEMGSGPADWVTFESPVVELASQETKLVKFTIEVPADTKTDDYKLGIAMEKIKKDANNANITIASRFILHTDVKVTENPKAISKNAPPNIEVKTITPTWKTYYFWISFVLFIISLGLLVWSTLHERKKPSSKSESSKAAVRKGQRPARKPVKPRKSAKR